MTERHRSGTATPEYASDLVVDFLVEAGFPYIALNPGSSFRGLHDSLVNYRGDAPAIIECTHEKTAVALAHGYAKASGQPMAVAVHDLVGLMHATMGVYMAQTDRIPVFMLGGSGPMDETRRRPWIDWIHSANSENELVRDFTVWDEHPVSVRGLWRALTRADHRMRREPRGPVYVALDALLQEELLPAEGVGDVPPVSQGRPTPLAAAPGELEGLLGRVRRAERPVVVPGYVGSSRQTWEDLTFVAERLGLGVFDPRLRLNFPTDSPLSLPDSTLLQSADLVVLLDLKDPAHKTGIFRKEDASGTPQLSPSATVVSVGLQDLGRSRWANDGGLFLSPDHAITAEGATALACLRELVADEPTDLSTPPHTEWRREILAAREQRNRRVREELDHACGERPVATNVLAAATWEALQGYDWVLAAGTLNDRIDGIWSFDRHYRHPGRSLGTATQFGIALGVALANRGTGRLVVSLQPDGDLLFDLGGLWTAQHHRLPLVCVMFNNRAYYNDWAHQLDVAELRGRDPARAWIGMALDGPAPDFAQIAKGFGWYAEGPIDDPAHVADAVRRAASVAMNEERPALVDVVCQPQ